ncbi:hypothetical protein Pla144_22770 [Bythopirellula polymerisocia]|uniref:Uncharacterized protein n=1 Tax=Bythopirellula polymerisocia TaxID=2528003 RepID=A0A5C6CRG0_9BACT|nr:hypothetical protein Pla144_22770 [Bythopirellula polymerisocia]
MRWVHRIGVAPDPGHAGSIFCSGSRGITQYGNFSNPLPGRYRVRPSRGRVLGGAVFRNFAQAFGRAIC